MANQGTNINMAGIYHCGDNEHNNIRLNSL